MEKEEIRCKKCGKTLIYFRIKTNERVCRSCGFTEIIKPKEVKK